MATPEAPMSPTKIPLLQEKPLATPATKTSDDSPPPTPRSDYAAEEHMQGAMRALIWGAFAPCAPIVIIASVLLTTVLHNQIPNEYVFLPTSQTTVGGESLSTLHGIQQIEANGGSRAYYLFHKELTNPAVLHMISSWTAKSRCTTSGHYQDRC
jgi:hypothetical protein